MNFMNWADFLNAGIDAISFSKTDILLFYFFFFFAFLLF